MYDRDPDLAQRIGAATALEVRASGIHYTFAPCVAVSHLNCYCSSFFMFCCLQVVGWIDFLLQILSFNWYTQSLPCGKTFYSMFFSKLILFILFSRTVNLTQSKWLLSSLFGSDRYAVIPDGEGAMRVIVKTPTLLGRWLPLSRAYRESLQKDTPKATLF